ncbi:hypothetical protein [Commensalibacter oyaizuii]|uniref:Tetratricopeptide repeat-like domain-containing protein n=1 Tax=Commensalibacter oyaizuii TaxID=3043873 RepID=A0ABT6PZZ4_9PROT|nr:hypothetical protein [Commensalibacter sp. TBRC 16381]MDI2090441.1 hypothetical protein [Commensalibacter sp. TBRC 16381]
MSDDLLKEITADIRAEKLRANARRYVIFAVALLVIVFTALGVWQYRVYQYNKTIEKASFSYFNTLYKIDPISGQPVSAEIQKQALEQFKALSDNSPQSIRSISQLEQAGILASEGKVKEASIIWETLSGDNTAKPEFRSLAGLLWIQHHLDTASSTELRNRIHKLIEQKTPWTALLKECQALLDIKTGKLIEARQVLGQLTIDMNAPPGVRERASMMLQIIASNKVANQKVPQ